MGEKETKQKKKGRKTGEKPPVRVREFLFNNVE
jgi:hypothetical protein